MINNKFKTFILLLSLSFLLGLLGYALGGRTGMQFALVMSFIFNFIAYYYSDQFVLKMYRANPLDKHYDYIFSDVKEITKNMGLPMPKLWLIETPVANAFATGRNPDNASIAITTGILDLLNHKELKAVLAHEVSHIKNRDILITTIAATIATAISYVANMAQYSLIFGNRDNENRRSNPLITMLLIIFLPIAALLIQLSISRSRELLADETSCQYNEDPLSLASALKKLADHVKSVHFQKADTVKASTATLFIVYPFTATTLINLFSTHPPVAIRIEALNRIYQQLKNEKN